MSGLIAVSYFLFTLIFSLVFFVLWVRIALRYFRISTLHPVARGLYQLTDPLILPIERLLPRAKGRQSRYDWAAFIVLVVLELFKFIVLKMLFLGALLSWPAIMIYVLADLIVQPCNLLFYAIIIRVIMSWINPVSSHPLAELLRLITEPSLRMARRLLPDFSGFDLSPILVLVVLQVITIFINASLPGSYL